MSRDVMPRRESLLVDWMTSNSTVLTGQPARYGATPAQALIYQNAVNFYVNLYQQCVDPLTRTKAKIAAKDAARREAIVAARQVIKLVEAFPEITNELLIELGIQPRKTPTPLPVPSSKPLVSVIQVSGSVATLTIRDIDNQDKRARPLGAAGANLFSFVGENAPTTPDQWKFEGQVTKTKFELELGSTLPAATKVWITACWYSARGETGPASDPIFTFTQAGGTTVQFGVMKMAA